MYWYIGIDEENGDTWYTYNYITFVSVNPPKEPYYNGMKKELVYPANKIMVIKAVKSKSQEEFETWYYNNIAKL